MKEARILLLFLLLLVAERDVSNFGMFAEAFTAGPLSGGRVTLPHDALKVLRNEARDRRELAELVPILAGVEVACKTIASLVGKPHLAGEVGSVNVQGEAQKKLDIISNEVMKEALCRTGELHSVASEEEDDPIQCPVVADKRAYAGDYALVFDPLDGSSNIDIGLPTGTIFGIFKLETNKDKPSKGLRSGSGAIGGPRSIMQPGRKLVAAGYCMYGAATTLMLTTGNGVKGFTLDPAVGEFMLSHPSVQIPRRGKTYHVNEGNFAEWDDAVKQYVSDLKNGKTRSGQSYGLRYIGAMVADVHSVLLKGGIFMYPRCKVKAPSGKLRLLYEANPMSMLVEQAGGKSTTGMRRILGINPDKVHQRVPVFLGSPEDVTEAQSYIRRESFKPPTL